MYSAMVSASTLSDQDSKSSAVPVEVVEYSGRYQLLRGGRPYLIKGAGMDANKLALFAEHGGNSVRTWTTGDDDSTGKLLNVADEFGVTVALCLDLGRERHGFDYDDEEAVARQLEFARREVLKYKDHPALLFWIVGNELNHSYSNPKVFDAINDISEMIHMVDGRHPTTTTLSQFNVELVEIVEERAPDFDFLSLQLYAGLDYLPQQLKQGGFDRPLMITEWGATGHWEARKTTWDAPIEANSSEKARLYLARYENVIAANPGQIIGSYVFLLGQKQERTPTWYGMLLEDGSRTEAMDVMHYIWRGIWPQNRAPQVIAMRLDAKEAEEGVVLRPGERYEANLETVDPGGGELTYQWVLMRESEATQEGGDAEYVPETVPVHIEVKNGGSITFLAPDEQGAYRLFVTVYDDNALAGHSNIPFLIVSSRQ